MDRCGLLWKVCGGGRGIRTPGTLSGTTVFKTAGINRSPIPPRGWKRAMVLVYRTFRSPTSTDSRASPTLTTKQSVDPTVLFRLGDSRFGERVNMRVFADPLDP